MTGDFLQKAVRVLKDPRRFDRSILAINKSPLRHAVKAGMSLRHLIAKWERIRSSSNLKLSEKEQNHVENLRDRGFTKLNGEIAASLLEELESYSKRQSLKQERKGKESRGNKDFWVYLSEENSDDSPLTTKSPLVRAALQETILRITASYFGEVPVLEYVLLTQSIPSDQPHKISQLWHQDRDDVKILKLFIYLTDVPDHAHGPFTFFDAKHSRNIHPGFFMRHMPDDEVFSQVAKESSVQMIGPKFSAFLVDTGRCFHMGSRLEKGTMRLMYTALFVSLPPIYPGRRDSGIRVVGALPSLQSMVVQRQ